MQLRYIHFYQKIARKKVARVNAALHTHHSAVATCQSNRSEGALAETEEALKLTELLHIKTDILRQQITLYFYNFAFMAEKKT